jgi:hypothetical protein
MSQFIQISQATVQEQCARKSTHLKLVHSSAKIQQPVLQPQDACRYIGDIARELERLARHVNNGELVALFNMVVVAADLEIVLNGTQ